MFSNQTRRVVATVAALAVALAGLLPVAHLHADDGHPLVHRHALLGELPDHDAERGIGHVNVDESDHSDAGSLALSYELARQLVRLAAPAVAPWYFANAQPTGVATSTGQPSLSTHDPPLRFTSSPAPPAVV